MNNKQYPDRPSSGGDGGGNDDGSGFSPSRLNHPYQQQQHPRQSSHGHEGDRSSRNQAHHVYTGDNRAGSYSPYDSHFNPPYYYNNNDSSNSNNRHQPVGSGPPPPPPHGVAVGASYYQQQFLQPQPENTKTEELLKKMLLKSAEMQQQQEMDMKKMETKQKEILDTMVTMQAKLLQRQSEPDRRVGSAVRRQQNAIKLEPQELIVIDDDEIVIKKENDDETTTGAERQHTSEMDMGMQTVTPASSVSAPSTMQAKSSTNGEKRKRDDEIVIKKENDDETTGAERQKHTSEMDMGMQTATPASSVSAPSTMQAKSSTKGERRKRKVPQRFVAETSEAHNKSRVNTQGLVSIRRQTVRTNTKTNISKRCKITVGSQKVYEITVMEPKSVIKVAVEYNDDEQIQCAACERLRKILTWIDKENMTSIDKDNVKNITSIEGVQMICNAMKKHRGQSMVISESCLAMTKFIEYDPNVSSKIADEGAINLIVAAISRWSKQSSKEPISNNKVLERGCEALNQLSNCDGNVRKIINSDGMNVVQTVMKNYPDRIELLNMGCYFLVQMTHHCMNTLSSFKNRVVIATEVVPVIIKAVLKEEKISIEVRSLFCYHVCALIAKLVALPAARKEVSESAPNAIAVIIKIWNATPDENADHVKKVAITALQYLASDSQAKIHKELFLAIRSNRDHSLHLVRTLNLTKELCINNEKIAHKIAIKEGVNIIMQVLKKISADNIMMKVLKKRSDDVTVQVAAFSVISAIGGKSEKYAPDLAAAIIAAMKNRNDNRKVQLSGCDSLFKISHHPSTHGIFKRMGLLKLLFHVKEYFEPRRKSIDGLITICQLPIIDLTVC